MVKIKKKWWSKKDIDKINEFITNSGREKGIQEAAAYFKVSTMSIRSRLWKCKNNINTKYISKNKKTTKVPIVKRKYTKKKSLIKDYPVTHKLYPVSREITFDIKDVKLDLKNNKLTVIY